MNKSSRAASKSLLILPDFLVYFLEPENNEEDFSINIIYSKWFMVHADLPDEM